MIKIAIIGAGISGLTTANFLENHAEITIFEKSRGVSGRTSTRRAEPYFFDHGAQYFKARSKNFKDFIAPLINQGIIERWDARFAEIDNRQIKSIRTWGEKNPHYVGSPGMNAISKYLAKDKDVRLGKTITSIKKESNKWTLVDSEGDEFKEYDWVLSTIPPEQAIDILSENVSFYDHINSVKMQACISLMFGFEDNLPLPFDAALVKGEDISWISVNSSKPNRAEPFCLLVHSTNEWANNHIDDDREQAQKYLCEQTSDVIGHDLMLADHKAIHGWKYANIGKQNGQTNLIDYDKKIGVCGDWLIQGRVESAFTSGFDLAHNIIQNME